MFNGFNGNRLQDRLLLSSIVILLVRAVSSVPSTWRFLHRRLSGELAMSLPSQRQASLGWRRRTSGTLVILGALLALAVLVLLFIVVFWRSMWWIDDDRTRLVVPVAQCSPANWQEPGLDGQESGLDCRTGGT